MKKETLNSAETTTALDIKVVEEKIKGMRKMVASTKVENDEQLAAVADYIKAVKTMGKFVRQEMEKYTKPAQEIINNARAKYLPYEKECDDAERLLKSKASAYMIEQEKIRKQKEDTIAKKVEDGKFKEQTGLKKMEALGEEKKTVATQTGAKLTLKTVKEVVIVDREQIPHEYWVVDEVKVRKVALAGGVIPGVEVRESKQMSA